MNIWYNMVSMKRTKLLFFIFAALLTGVAFGSGFSLYQYSATANAMGGALVGRAMDASANFVNPATLTDLTNIEFSVGFITEHPRGRVRVRRNDQSLGEHGMEPGMFVLPHFQLAVPLPKGFAFGFGIAPEFGLGTKFCENWCMAWNCTETTVQSLSFVPNIAYKITDDWSVAVGLRWLYFDFEQYSYPNVGNYGHFKCHLDGDNGWSDFGWQIGTKYDILDNLSVGLVYKSRIDSRITGKSEGSHRTYPNAIAGVLGYDPASRIDGDAEAEMRLPQSLTGGINWDVTDDWHLGFAVSWTEWSTIDTLVFNLNGTDSLRSLGWKDTWRASLGVAYDINEDWTAMLSYVFDMDSTDARQCSVMLPPADRHIASCGFTWHVWEGFYLSGCYSCIFMHGQGMHCNDTTGDGALYDVTTSRGFCHAAGLTLTYRF